ncbi:MAG: hypothetical protein AAF530_11965 [Pseudomonadota bacterium]
MFAESLIVAALFWAQAPLVDGSWCAADGRRITVEGLTVLTPEGQRTQGEYGDRAFRFQAPPGEWPAGAIIWMELKSSDSVRVSVESDSQQGPPPHDRWIRCDVVS